MPATLKTGDLWQWLAVNEERLLLHDGLMHMADHIAVPSGVADVSEEDLGLPVLDGKSPDELSKIIRKECSTKTTTYASLMEYRLNALKGLWQALKELNEKRASSASKEISSATQGSGGHSVSFSSRISLVLIFPIMKSLSKFDPTLSSETASILLESLRACDPLSLSSEPHDCISGLENLLCSWLNTVQESSDVPLAQVQNASSALVALSVAVGTGSLLLRTVHMLQSLKTSYPSLDLLVPGILNKLLWEHVTQEDSSALTADSHLLCWGYDDGLVQDGKEGSGPRSIVFDGKFVYLTSSSLKYLLKLGTGKRGTIRGFVYTSCEVDPGWVVLVNGKLLHRKTGDGESVENFCALVDCTTLKPSGAVKLEEGPTEPVHSLQFLSDGMFIYWVYALKAQETVTHPVTGEKMKQHSVYVHTLELKASEEDPSNFVLVPRGERVLLQRSGPDVDKNSDVVKALVRANPSYASTAISLLGGSKDDSSGATSTGLTMRILQKCAAYTTGSSLVLLTAPPTSGGRGGLFGVQSGSSSKALCFNLCFSIVSGKSLAQVDLFPTPQLHCALSKGASVETMAACYDCRNHCVWTCNDDWIDIWDCAGKVKAAAHQLASRLGKTNIRDLIPPVEEKQEDSHSSTIPVSEAITLMLRHIGIESCRLVPGFEFSTTVVHSLPLSFLKQCCDLLESSLEEKNWANALAVTITLQAVLPAFLTIDKHPSDKLIPLKDRVRVLIWSLLTNPDCTEPLLTEAKRVISRNSEALFLNHSGCDEFITTLLNADSSQPSLLSLRNDLLMQTAHYLQNSSTLSTHIASVSKLVTQSIVSDSIGAMEQCFECSLDQLPTFVAQYPLFTPSLQCAAMLVNVSLRRVMLAVQAVEDYRELEASGEEGDLSNGDKTKEETMKELEDARDALLELCDNLDVFGACKKTLQKLCSLAEVLDLDESSTSGSTASLTGGRQSRLQAIERATRGTVLGCILQPLLAVVSDSEVCTLQMANTLQIHFSALAQLAAQACSLLFGSAGDTLNIKIPAPWATGRLIETIHPVRDNYKFKETVSFPGAKNLYLKFDSRCSSQYDYDKVVLYMGDSTSSQKVAEFGGNTHNFGSRSVLGKGWPKDLVKIEGDTVTFTFEMKSGREHSTPDKAMWGFACTVRPQESAEEGATGLPFVTDLYLSLASVCCSLIGCLYAGPPPSAEEEACQHLMDFELLQNCIWSVDEGSPEVLPLDVKKFPVPSPSSHSPLPPEVIQQLRVLVGKPQPTLRPSTRELLQPDVLEDAIISACLKHYGLETALQLLGRSPDSPQMETTKAHLDAIISRVNGLERRLQALAELERNWWHDVDDMTKVEQATSIEPFFFTLLQQESTIKSFELLCCLKNVELNHNDLHSTANQLQDLLELDVEKRRNGQGGQPLDFTPVTRSLVKGVRERAELLLNVTIASEDYTVASPRDEKPSSRDDTLTVTSPTSSIARSISAPPTAFEFGLRRQKSGVARSKQSLLDVPASVDRSNLLDQIFQFIGSKPEQAVSCDSFLTAASRQWRRGVCRVRALGYLHQLLTSDSVSLAVEHLLASVGAVLQQGPRVRDIACGGMAGKVREIFASVMHAVVDLASKQPAACINTIAMLCIVPYTRLEEQCLVRSGLVKLLDQLCSLVDSKKPLEVGGEEDESLHRVTSLAWAAFQVLADHCVSWETQNSAVLSSGLAQQVSLLLTNHLSRAMERLVVSESGASEGLQDALSLLLGLAKSHMGRAILSQPACVSKLLLLLTDQRPSPKLVLIALQLCRIALPLMTVAECSQVTVPAHPSLSVSKTNEDESSGSSLAADIVKLLLAKLAEYIVPDASQVPAKQVTDDGHLSPLEPDLAHLPHPHLAHTKEEEFESESGQASVYVYKRQNESAAEILQPLISQDPRQFRLSGHRMQEVMQMDRALTEHGKAEVVTDSYRSCLRRALRWATMGFTVSVEAPSGARGESMVSVVDKKKARAEAAAKKKNLELLKTDPPRPFVSGHVAYSLASEVIGLLHGLLTEPGAAEVWRTAIKKSVLQSLLSIPDLTPTLASYTESVHTNVATGAQPGQPGNLLQAACIANATFAALGGFKESIRPGMKVKVLGEGVEDTYGIIQSISERRGLANVQFTDDEVCFGVNKTLEVPLSRLAPPQKDVLPLKQLGVTEQLCRAIFSLLKTSTPSLTHAHSSSDANTSPLGFCRLFAELRTRACAALAYHVRDKGFAEKIMKDSEGMLEFSLLNDEAQRSNNGSRVSLVENHCQSLRMLYRDCARPAPPRIEKPRVEPKSIQLDIVRSWPPVTSCSFTHKLTSVTYQGPTASTAAPVPSSTGNGGSQDTPQPKGVIVYANTAIPALAPSFYWELEVSHLGDSSSDAAHIAMGYSPSPQKPGEGEQWSYPTGSCLIRSSGRACQVSSDNFLEWNTFRFNSPLKSGDVVGCGWVKNEEGMRGTVYFTLNGEKQANEFQDCPSDILPFLHIQKKASRVRVNFGDRPFAYVEGHAHRNAADIQEEGDTTEELVANFGALPFAMSGSDSEGEGSIGGESGGRGSVIELAQSGPPVRKMKPPIATIGYDSEASLGYQSQRSFDTMLESGPLIRPGGGVQEEESEEEGSSSSQEEDLHTLLVKAWEAKVFPVIQRRFRNDQERKSGLEQIKGALQLGMESIAQETVEFLYEENGGIPKDLHLPTMDDVKAELGKFTISRVKKSSAVVIQKELPYARCGVRTMQKTQGLTGIVLSVDESNEVVQVECYLQNEGALVRFWYPVMYLERPPPGYRKSSTLRGADAANMLVHRELLKCEASLTSMYCRRALLTIQQASSRSVDELFNHLRLVSAECLAEPLPEGLSTTTNPDLTPSPSSALHAITLSPLHMFYSNTSRIESELLSAFENVSRNMEDFSQYMCECLQKAPQDFGAMELKITDAKEACDIAFQDGVFLLVSCVDEKGTGSKPPPSSTYKYPWARVLCYRGGQSKGGRQQLQEVARYPNEITQVSTNQYCGSTYPSLVLPFNKIHIKCGGCHTRPVKMLNILALPADFPLALSFVHKLSRHVVQLHDKQPASESTRQCVMTLSLCLESLSKLINRLDIPIPLKELVLHQMADILWTLCYTGATPSDQATKLYALPNEFLQNIRQELIKLFEAESNRFSSTKARSSGGGLAFPPPGSIGDGGSGKFSTYFQALLEFVLASIEYQNKFHGGEPLLLSISTTASAPALLATPSTPPTPSHQPIATPNSSSAAAVSTSSSSAASSSATPSTEGGSGKKSTKRTRSRKSISKKESTETSSKRKDDWFNHVQVAVSILRGVTQEGEVKIPSQINKASLVSSSKPSSRLVVVTKLDPKLSIEGTEKVMRSVCNLYGGLYKDELYLPVEEIEPTELKDVEEETKASKGAEGSDGKKTESMLQETAEDGIDTAPPSATTDDSGEPQAQAEPVPTAPTQDDKSETQASDATLTPQPSPTHRLVGHAVIELCCNTQVSGVSSALVSSTALQVEDCSPQVSAVSNSLRCGDDEESANKVVVEYLQQKLVKEDGGGGLVEEAETCLRGIFRSSVAGESSGSDVIASSSKVCNELQQFFSGFVQNGCGLTVDEQLTKVWKSCANEQGQLSLKAFVNWVVKQLESEVGVRGVWLGLESSGYDLHFERCSFPTSIQSTCHQLTPEQDHALVHHIDSLCRHLSTTADSLEAWDISLSDTHITSQKLSPLQGLSLSDVRLRFLQIKHINRQFSLLLSAIDMRSTHPLSLGSLLTKMSPLLFYDVKIAFLHSVLNASTRRSLDQAPPEVKMDPLEVVGGISSETLSTQFCQAAQQMLSVPSAQLCVALASGGDPTYAFNVKLSGEEVHGTSGSFRHFLWQVVRELQSSVLPILLPCPSGAAGINHGKYILVPGPMTFSEEKLLQFFGQLLAVAIRADVPIALDLLPSFWKSLKREPLSLADLREADCITYNLTCKLLECSTPEEFDELVGGLIHHVKEPSGDEGEKASLSAPMSENLRFVFLGLDGIEYELRPSGRDKIVEFSNRQEFVSEVRDFRLRELSCDYRMQAVRCGFASVIPLEVLGILTAEDLDLRVCGVPYIDLEYLKRHTMYQVGLMESDRHVQFFWHALESFSKDELRKFVKFACNQERIPFGHPCRDGGRDSGMHVPPYPMKIAPPDGKGPPDNRYIRAETCMFMIKLPQYSSQQIMTERLRYAIHCREDPLSG